VVISFATCNVVLPGKRGGSKKGSKAENQRRLVLGAGEISGLPVNNARRASLSSPLDGGV